VRDGAVDLIDGLARGVGHNFAALLDSDARACVAAGQPVGSGGAERLLRLLRQCLEDDEDEVRQSALGLVGDLACHCPSVFTGAGNGDEAATLAAEQLAHASASGNGHGHGHGNGHGNTGVGLGAASAVVELLVKSMSPAMSRQVCSNAVWALGELAVAFGAPLVAPFAAAAAVGPLSALLARDDCHPNLLENVAGTLGRLALCCPEALAPHAERFAPSWLLALQSLSGDEERDQSFRGLVRLCPLAWEPLVATRYPDFLSAVASWTYYDDPAPELKSQIQEVINHASRQLSEQAGAAGAGGVDPNLYLGALEDGYRTYLLTEFRFG